jgi:hypothetical protein
MILYEITHIETGELVSVVAEDANKAIETSGFDPNEFLTITIKGKVKVQEQSPATGIPHDATHFDPEIKDWYRETSKKGFEYWNPIDRDWFETLMSSDQVARLIKVVK